MSEPFVKDQAHRERIEKGEAILPSYPVTTELVDEVAKWLHDETSHPDSYPDHTWPETDRDDGQREGGFVKIVPQHGQAYFRDIARRLIGRFGEPLGVAQEARKPIAWMNSAHVESYQTGQKDGIAWASPVQSDFYTVALYAGPSVSSTTRGSSG